MAEITLKFKDGKTIQSEAGVLLWDAVKEVYPKAHDKVVAAKVDSVLKDLQTTVDSDAVIEPVRVDSPEGLDIFWHSSSHIMAQAVQALYPGAKLGIGPSIENGFYYDFEVDETITPEDLEKIEAEVTRIVAEDQIFKREVLSKDEALTFFKERGEHFKLELINDIPDETVSIYKNGPFVDLCRGPHVPTTKYIQFMKLLSVAGAYWRGSERNAMLQRIYGVAFNSEKLLKKYLHNLEEAKNRDHRKLGKELDLFSFQPEGPGFVFWHPKGMTLYQEVAAYIREELTRRDYQEINTPIILNEELWHRSGHWDNYKENMYFTQIDEQDYAVKPMNCPGGLLVFKNKLHSYRELPVKYAELGLVHRHEKSGVLHGLFRVRQFTQDDAHVYCTPDQIEDEVIAIIDLIHHVYTTFGFNNFSLELSTKPQKAIGSDEMWERAENALKGALDNLKLAYQLNPGDGAFYGPKIDFHIRDSLGRMWQCGTIQLDFSMPERFELEYIGPDGEKHRPVMIHRAIFGSIERFIGILIEHYGGSFPTWLAPVQVVVIPISEKHSDAAKQVYDTLKENGIRVQIDTRNEKVGYKIREAETQKIPYMCVIGDQEIENNTVAVRRHKKGNVGQKTVDTFLNEIQEEIARRTAHQER